MENPSNIMRRVRDVLRGVLPASSVVQLDPSPGPLINFRVNGQLLRTYWIGEGWPNQVQRAIAIVKADRPDVLVARRMSPGAQAAVERAGLGWIDESGAAVVSLPWLILSRTGQPQSYHASSSKVSYVSLSYPTEQNLLSQAQRATDFLILDLASHFRKYDLRVSLPALTQAASISNVRNVSQIAKRFSGHVTGSFAEAMCPWVLKRLGILTGRYYRLSGWARGSLGQFIADFIITSGSQKLPCEVKHYAGETRLRTDGLKAALVQVSSSLLYLPATDGYLFVATALPSTGTRYKIDVVRLAS